MKNKIRLRYLAAAFGLFMLADLSFQAGRVAEDLNQPECAITASEFRQAMSQMNPVMIGIDPS